MADRYILMGDIIGSSTHDVGKLRREFAQLVASCNTELQAEILSPYTVTLGDEFQGVARSLRGLLNAVFCLEETALQRSLGFSMRYVGLYGEIETPINRIRAHGMMGAGLTRSRELLTDKRRQTCRFRFELPDDRMTRQLNRLFLIIEGLVARWHPQDGPLILEMIANPSNKEVGEKYGKNRTQIWKRRKHLLIEEFRALQEAVMDLSQ